MMFPLSFALPLVLSLSLQGLLWYTFLFDNQLLDRSRILHLGLVATAIALISLVLYRVLVTASPSRWSPWFLLCTLMQVTSLVSGLWFAGSALVGEPLHWGFWR